MDSTHLGKMIKRKDGQKLNHKKRDIRNKCIPEWKVRHGLSKKQHQKEEKLRNRERLNLLGDGTKQALVPREQNRRINGSLGL